jgi:hypothetical protein
MLLHGKGEEMDATKIKEFARQIDDSRAEGRFYHIHYTVAERATDAFYAHKKELIKLMQDTIAKETADPALNPQSPGMAERHANFRSIIAAMQKDLNQARGRNYTCEYDVDGVGYYLKQSLSHKSADGTVRPTSTTAFVSDGKIMGTFYMDNSQGVIEPATERPRTPLEYWTQTAYNFSHDTVAACVETMGNLKLAVDDKQLVITGVNYFDRNQKTTMELRFDKATLTPAEGRLIFYDSHGRVHTEVTKTWQFRIFSGVRLPAAVVEQFSETDLSGKLNLEKERVFTIVDFNLTPASAKDAFAQLLRSNFSMYDEITGEHYLAGSPAQVLDKLSR